MATEFGILVLFPSFGILVTLAFQNRLYRRRNRTRVQACKPCLTSPDSSYGSCTSRPQSPIELQSFLFIWLLSQNSTHLFWHPFRSSTPSNYIDVMVSLNTSSKTLAEAYTLDSTISGTKQSDSDGRIKLSSMSSFNQGNRPRPVPAAMSFLFFSHDRLIFMNFCHDIKPARRPPSLAHSHSVLYGRYAIVNCAQKDMRRCQVMIALTRRNLKSVICRGQTSGNDKTKVSYLSFDLL